MIFQRIFFIWIATISCAIAAEPPVSDMLTIIHRYVPSAKLATNIALSVSTFAGDFTSSPELVRRLGGPGAELSGNHLYLFVDQSYIYVEWADIMPLTIYDKGTWRFDGQFIQLQTDNTVPQKHTRHDRVFIPLATEISGVKQLSILGIDHGYGCLQKFAEKDGDFNFHLCSRARIGGITDTSATKTRLMKEAWRPAFFRE